MAKRKLTEEDKKNIKLLQAQNEMYERTKEEIRMRAKPEKLEETLNQTSFAQEDVNAQLKMLMGESYAEATEIPSKNEETEKDVFTLLRENEAEEREKAEFHTQTENQIAEEEVVYTTYDNDVKVNASKTNEAYDIIPLPSNGQCYKNKVGRIPVSYLTAYDENLITSPNLYRDGLVIDLLLKNKIKDDSINIDNLVAGDVDAIVLFLRATSYGVDFPISVEDPSTGEKIETTIDLSTIKTKEFKLVSDENGYFDYTLPKTGKIVKFKYLTRKEEKDLRTLNEMENNALAAGNIRLASEIIKTALKVDNSIDGREKQLIYDNNSRLENWAKAIESKRKVMFNKAITNRMEMQIVSIDGVTDRKELKSLIDSMPAIDSLKLRKYILENEPGLDFEIEVQRPESLGGGSFKTFLEWSDTVFLNIA